MCPGEMLWCHRGCSWKMHLFPGVIFDFPMEVLDFSREVPEVSLEIILYFQDVLGSS